MRDRFGVKLTLVSPPVTPEKLEQALTPETRLVALSHVDWTTGEVLPLEEICVAAREHGALTLVDGAQSVGNLSVDAPATGADMYAFTGHKWLLGPEGMGSLYVSPECRTHSPNLGYLSIADPKSFGPEGNYELHPGARRFESSTMSPALAGGFAIALEAAAERGDAGLQEIHRRAELLMDLLSKTPRVTLRTPRPARTGLVSFEVEGVPAKEVAEKLLEQATVRRALHSGAKPLRPGERPSLQYGGGAGGAGEAVNRLRSACKRWRLLANVSNVAISARTAAIDCTSTLSV